MHMNNGNESEKDAVNILSKNTGNQNQFIVFAPVFMLGLGFLVFLVLVGMLVFFLVRRTDFLAFMPNVFTTALELLMWLGIVFVVGIAVRFVLGGAVKDVCAPMVEILLRAFGELRKDRVVHANDNFMAYTGEIKIAHHEDIRQNYTIKQVDAPAPVPFLEGPNIRYARDLYETGRLFEAIRNGKIMLGHGIKENGSSTVWCIPRKDYFSTIAGGLPSSGKCLGKDTPVMLFDGSITPVQDIHVGDLLMGPDSQPRRVLSTNKGHGPLYRIIPKRGMSWVCNDVHMMTLKDTHRQSTQRGRIKDIPLHEYLACHSKSYRSVGEKWKLFRVGVEFPDTPLDVDPYLVGLWVGDGTTDTVRFTSQDEQIIQYLVGAAPHYGMQAVVDHRKNCGNAQSIRFHLGTRQAMGGNHLGTYTPNILRCVLLKHCRNAQGGKIIPHAYLKNSREKRLQLLAGLLDTDGYSSDRNGRCSGGYEMNTKHEHLADQIAFLAQSLGFAAHVTPKPMSIEHSGEIQTSYRISIAGHVSDIPCRIPSKQAPTRTSKRDVLATGWDAQPIGNGDYYGFTLDGDGRFLLGDFTVTHNTTTAYWILVQQILIGARIVLIDPHMHYQSEDGKKSLTKELRPFANSYVFPPIDASSPGAIMQRIKWLKHTVDERKRPGYIARLSDSVILVIDEVNSVFELEEIRTHLADALSYIQREGRKFGVHTMLLGHRWSRDDIGKVNIRTVASTIMAHKQNDENQAALLVGSKKHVQEVLNLTPGSYLFRGVNAMVDDDGTQEYRLTKVQTPMISAHDASWVLQLKQDVDAWLAASDPHSTPASKTQQFSENGSHSKPPGNVVEGTLAEHISPELLRLMYKVMEVEADGVRNQEELIERVWGPEYTTGRKRQEIAIPQLMQIRKAIALQLARVRSNA